jgi:hypothetical protein
VTAGGSQAAEVAKGVQLSNVQHLFSTPIGRKRMIDYINVCGRPVEEVEAAIEKMAARTEITRRHVEMTHRIFDELWPAAAEGSVAEWGCAMEEIDKVIEYIQENARSFPNKDIHIEQWTALKEIASCCKCACTKRCQFKVCPRRKL